MQNNQRSNVKKEKNFQLQEARPPLLDTPTVKQHENRSKPPLLDTPMISLLDNKKVVN